MEEQKNKEIKLEAAEGINNQEKLTYEQLNNACMQLSQQNQYYRQQLEQANKVLNTFSRLDYLFRVVEVSGKDGQYSFDAEFVNKCISEIQEIMTIPEEKETGEGN